MQTQQEIINPYQNPQFLEEAFIRLCEIRRKIQELQKEEEIIKDWALYFAEEYLLKGEKEGDFEVNDFKVRVAIAQRKIFEYPEEVKQLEQTLKNKKKESELNGTAKVISINRYLVFKF
jgi:predicted nucleotide-binding protein (sugar kinase/HSP70/actin superfamily)